MKGSALETPMMRQFLKIKAQYPDAILFYRMGDFYEMFLEDAQLAAPLLDIALTTRDKGKPDAVPMCGVPVHAADGHIKRLAQLGHRVAICEQTEDPKSVGGKRLVKRDVVEVVTPGLIGDPSGLEGRQEVSVAALFVADRGLGLAALDASTGDFRATEPRVESTAGTPSTDDLPGLVWQELARIAPRELLVDSRLAETLGGRFARRMPSTVVTGIEADRFEPGSLPVESEGLDRNARDPASRAAAALLAYLGENQPFALSSPPRLRRYALAETVVLDPATRSHLELLENAQDRGRAGTLIDVIDRTRTALGARRLARWIAYPLLDPEAIAARQTGVAHLFDHDRPRARLREALAAVRDLERLLAKGSRPGAVPRDLGLLRSSLAALPGVIEALEALDRSADGEMIAGGRPDCLRAPEDLPELRHLLAEALVDDPPVVARGSRGANEIGYIRPGFRPELDGLRESAEKGREWIAGLEQRERERTGIATLKARYHPVHGYSLEVSKAHLAKVPDDYTRKQTLASVERFTTEELREVESKVLGAHERAARLEREIFENLKQSVVENAATVRRAAEAVADLDALASLAESARLLDWVRPVVDDGESLEIVGGRHPVVESMLAKQGVDGFVPNDARLDPNDAQILLLTGPNMSGKSTYLRQVALIVLLAQIGSYVPADSARIGVVDRVFTRVGASDRLAQGESTFMVEMRETAEILSQATRRSLLILDEIGRGTSTFDGLSIAWAVAEYLHDTPGIEARTLFATHYHELTDLAERMPRLRNAHFEVREWQDDVIFLRRLVPGGANRSYGIQVARLAGLPAPVIDRARAILETLERGDGATRPPVTPGRGRPSEPTGQLSLALGSAPDPALEAMAERVLGVDPDRMTPLQALELVHALKTELAGRRGRGEGPTG